jgi:TRAP-type mannitol/chloroaromatic compound transport system substrate-binding protein
MTKKLSRRAFLAGAAAGAGALAGAPSVIAQAKLKWNMVTAWPANFPVLQAGAERMAARIGQMSQGRLAIKVYAGGELVPPLETFNAVSSGVAQMGHAASYYWAGTIPEAQFFTSVPFGMTTHQTNAWLHHGGGIELWNKVYAPFGLVALPALNTGCQMDGWFKKEIKTLADYKGLRIRVPGLGGKIMARAGANVTLIAGSELYTALERGVIDAADWIGPFHDLTLGLDRAAKFYYYPAWREPCGVGELTINRKAWESIPADLKAIVRAAAIEAGAMTLAEIEVRNSAALVEIETNGKVKIARHSNELLRQLKKLAAETIGALAASSPGCRMVHESYSRFQAGQDAWAALGDKAQAAARGL